MKLTMTGNYLKPDQAKKGSIITILNEGEYVTSEKYKYDDGTPKVSFELKVKYENKEHKMRVNKASRIALVEVWGDETAFWIGKQAKLMIMPTPKGDQKMIVLDPIVETTAPATPKKDEWEN